MMIISLLFQRTDPFLTLFACRMKDQRIVEYGFMLFISIENPLEIAISQFLQPSAHHTFQGFFLTPSPQLWRIFSEHSRSIILILD